MAKKAKKGNGKAKGAAKPEQPKLEPKPKAKPKGQAPDLDALRKPVLDANAGLTKAETEAKALVERGLELITQAKGAYREAVAAGDIVDRGDGIKVDIFSCCDHRGKRGPGGCSFPGSQ
jgi:hypothetical protein